MDTKVQVTPDLVRNRMLKCQANITCLFNRVVRSEMETMTEFEYAHQFLTPLDDVTWKLVVWGAKSSCYTRFMMHGQGRIVFAN